MQFISAKIEANKIFELMDDYEQVSFFCIFLYLTNFFVDG